MESMLIFTGSLACLVGVMALLERWWNYLGVGRGKKA
jgi:hypothetical protein